MAEPESAVNLVNQRPDIMLGLPEETDLDQIVIHAEHRCTRCVLFANHSNFKYFSTASADGTQVMPGENSKAIVRS